MQSDWIKKYIDFNTEKKKKKIQKINLRKVCSN